MKWLLFFIFPAVLASPPLLESPFFKERYVLCDQGNQSPEFDHHGNRNSHHAKVSKYALDLHSPPTADPLSIKSGIEGLVIANTSCPNTTNMCASGWGNYVRILRFDGLLVQYAHMKEVFVKTGQWIRAGKVIGIEGESGNAGHKHLHISVHQDWRASGYELYKRDDRLPPTIPFLLPAWQGNHQAPTYQPIDSRNIRCKRVTGKNEALYFYR